MGRIAIPSTRLDQSRAGSSAAPVMVARGLTKRPVAIGHRGDSEAEVLGGVAAGERVILYPSDQGEDGVRVK